MYNLQLPHLTSNFLNVAMIIMVATVMVVMLVMVVIVERTGREGTRPDKLCKLFSQADFLQTTIFSSSPARTNLQFVVLDNFYANK